MTTPVGAGPIAGYGLLSDCNSSALVDRSGSIDWMCLPRFDSRSVFARLLDPEAGHWSLRPVDTFEASRRYVPGTLVIETTFHTATGTVRVTDAMAFSDEPDGHSPGLNAPHEVLRMVEGIEGTVDLDCRIALRPEYGLNRPAIVPHEGGLCTFGGPDRFMVRSGVSLEIERSDIRAHFSVSSGEEATFSLRWGPADHTPSARTPAEVADAVRNTIGQWQAWEEAHSIYEGPHAEQVRLSARVLQGLTHRPTGAIVAAPTTSLPETVGGERNWDYRFTWIRDASLTLQALYIGACPDEVHEFVSWMAGAAGGHATADDPLQIMYGIAGERDLTERELPHLRGWRDSSPVRIGNGAWTQRQLDVYGEFLDALLLYVGKLGELDPVIEHFIEDLADAAMNEWEEPDQGLWEMRSEPQHHVSSKLMCWVALDRAVQLAPDVGASHRIEEWAGTRDRIRELILKRGWSEKRQAYAQAFDSDHLDASVLLMPLVGFLPADDERMASTIRAVAEDLTEDGMVLRYRAEDGLEGDEGTFVICTFWLISCLSKMGDVDAAREMFDRVAGYANDLGLLAEEIDTSSGELLGNFPQAFSHIGLITAAWELDKARA